MFFVSEAVQGRVISDKRLVIYISKIFEEFMEVILLSLITFGSFTVDDSIGRFLASKSMLDKSYKTFNNFISFY